MPAASPALEMTGSQWDILDKLGKTESPPRKQIDHREGRGPAVRAGRARVVPAAPGARRAPGRAEPAAGHRVRRDRPRGDPERGPAAGPALPWQARAQPAGAGEVHHTKHKANGGKTSVKDCVLLCAFHHQVVIHRWGWTLVVNPDGTTTAWNKNKTKVLHSHGPPARAG